MTSPYRKDVRHLDELDLYVLAELYDVKSHAVFHAIKKLICAGKRGAKDYEQDLMEAIESIERELQMIPAQDEAPAVDCFDEQRIDAIGQNGGEPHYDDWRMKVDWSLASPHHQFAFLCANGVVSFSMYPPKYFEFIARPSAQ